jgi:hypothetical protein
MGAPLYALIAAIKQSPIVVRLSERLLLTRDWASVRKSPDVDAYVLAWIANHVSGTRRSPRTLMSSIPEGDAGHGDGPGALLEPCGVNSGTAISRVSFADIK